MKTDQNATKHNLHGAMLCGAVVLLLGVSGCGQGNDDQFTDDVAVEAATETETEDANGADAEAVETDVDDVTTSGVVNLDESEPADNDNQVMRIYDAPEGVTLEDIELDGHDLIITMPTGDVLRIEDGAINFDSLEVDGVVFEIADPDFMPCRLPQGMEGYSCVSPNSRIYEAPDGVTLNDIALDGRDLLITMPTGEILRIEDAQESFDAIMIDSIAFPIFDDAVIE